VSPGLKQWPGARTAIATGLALLLLQPAHSAASPGDLDPKFGRDGVARVPSVLRPTAVAAGPRGSVIVTGISAAQPDTNGIVVRLDASGRPDPAFGDAGAVVFDIGSFGPGPTDVVVDQQGRVVVVGGDPSGAFVIRLTASGQPDPSFGSGGRVQGLGASRSLTFARAAALTAEGKILVAAEERETSTSEGPPNFALARLNDEGSLDSAFGSDGIATAPVGNAGGSFGGGALRVAADGKILFGARRLAQLTPSGQLDSDFGVGGLTRWEASQTARFNSIATTASRIAVAYTSCEVTGPGAGCYSGAATLTRQGARVSEDPNTAAMYLTNKGRRTLYAAGVTAGGKRPPTAAFRLLSGNLKPQRFGNGRATRVYVSKRPVAPAGIARSSNGSPLLLGQRGDGTAVVARARSNVDEPAPGRIALLVQSDTRRCPSDRWIEPVHVLALQVRHRPIAPACVVLLQHKLDAAIPDHPRKVFATRKHCRNSSRPSSKSFRARALVRLSPCQLVATMTVSM